MKIIDLRKFYTTTKGELVELYCFDPRPQFQLPVKGYILSKTNNVLNKRRGAWTSKGLYTLLIKDHEDNLVEVTQEEHETLKLCLLRRGLAMFSNVKQ